MVDSLDYPYRVVFTYLSAPKKIALPFVRIKQNKAIFYFEDKLSRENLKKIKTIGFELNQADKYSPTMREETRLGTLWVKIEEN